MPPLTPTLQLRTLMHQSACSSSVSTAPRLRIPTCSYVLPRGSRCLGAAVRGRSYCRHHLRIRIRLRRMARSRRATPVLAPVSLVDAAAIRQTEIGFRVFLEAGRIDPAAGPVIFQALRMARDLVRILYRQEKRGPRPHSCQTQRPNFNRINQVPLNPLDLGSCLKDDS